jgi:hypothetical protein
MSEYPFLPYHIDRLPEAEMRRRGQELLAELSRRRSVRHFAADPVPCELIELAIRIAATAPSGAHRQPWRSTFFAAAWRAGPTHSVTPIRPVAA